MTKEVKIKRALDLYDFQMEAHRIEYNARFHSLKEDESGQIDGDELLELNMWDIQEENHIRNDFVKAVLAAAE